jgi:orotidine-5'-phosphate decarboxylase
VTERTVQPRRIGRAVKAPIAVALDAPDAETAARWAAAVTPHVAVVKIGLELFCTAGPSIVRSVRGASGTGLFLDLKLHDIPNTVAGAARSVARLKPTFLTVHALGGPEMVKAAVLAAEGVTIAAVTVLTSADDATLDAVGLAGPSLDAVRRLSVLAVGAGAGALVCSPHEVAAVRAEVGPDVVLITPVCVPPAAPPRTRCGSPPPSGRSPTAPTCSSSAGPSPPRPIRAPPPRGSPPELSSRRS